MSSTPKRASVGRWTNRPAWLALGALIAVSHLTPALAQAWRPALVGQGAVTVGYTDNVFSVADDATDPPHASDWFYRLRAGVAAHFVGRRQYALVEYMAEGERYQTQTNEILWVHRASGVLSRTLSRRSTLDAAAGYERGRAHVFAGAGARRDQTLGVRVGERAFSLLRGSERIDHEVSDTLSVFQRGWAQKFASEDTQANNASGFELGGQVGLEREWRSTTGFLTAGPRYVSFAQLGAPERTRDLLLDASARAVRDLVRWGRPWAAALEVGATLVSPVGRPDRNVVQPTAMAQLTYAPPDAGYAMLTLRRSVVPSFEAGASTVSDRVMVAGGLPLLWHQLEQRPRLMLDGAAGWEQSRAASEVAQTRFVVRFADLGATFAPVVGVGVSLRYAYINQRVRQDDGASDALSSLGDYERHTVMLVISGMLPGRGPRVAHVTGLGYSPSGDVALPRSVLSPGTGVGAGGTVGGGDGR